MAPPPEALLSRLRRLAQPDATADPGLLADLAAQRDAPTLAEAGRLLAAVPAELLGGKPRPLRVAITASFTASGVAPLLRVALRCSGIAPVIHSSGFDQLMADLTDPGSALAEFAPDVTFCLLHDDWLLPATIEPGDPGTLREALGARLAMVETAIAGFTERTGSAVVVHTVPLSPEHTRGVISLAGRAELGRIWREANATLLDLPSRHRQVHALDLEALLVHTPVTVRDDRLYRFASAAWSGAVEATFAQEAAALCRAMAGLARKVLVLDLDNTLWGGVVGDDGPGGIALGPLYPGNCYTAVQRYALALRKQGVVLALASKNDPAVVDGVLADHPDMVLRPADIAAKAVSWEPKPQTIAGLAETLNLGLDSFVFADDSAFETDLVASSLPAVTVLHLDGDPADHLGTLLHGNHFDVLATTASDAGRTELYRARAERTEFAGGFDSLPDYLAGLDIRVGVRPVDEYSLPRLLQLGVRTNQFTMTGRGHPEARTRRMAESADALVLVFDVTDRFGAEGIVGGLWISKHDDHWLIENMVMSCRVFSRGIEHTVLQHVIDLAIAAGASSLDGDFRATDRNGPAAACYPAAGFRPLPGSPGDELTRYRLDLSTRPRISPEWTRLHTEGALADA
jgi:FkbH-like protein